MKKLFIAMLAVAAVTACAKDEAISIDRQAIGFGNPFVENAVRADYSGNLINSFKVYGTVTGNGNTVTLYNGATVTRGTATYGSPFTCTQTEYWVPSCSYAFQAVVDGAITVVDGKQVINYTIGQDVDTDGISDLLYSAATVTTNPSATPTPVNANGCVAFTFEHLLSKIGFSFENGLENSPYGYTITAVSFIGHDSEGTYTIGSGWDTTVTASSTDLDFGKGDVTHQIIPGNQTLNVTIAYDILYNGTKISATSVAKELTYTFAQNTNYNIKVTIPAPGGEIKFTTQAVGTWTPNTGGNLDLN